MAVNAGPALSVRMRTDVNSNVLIETKIRALSFGALSHSNRYPNGAYYAKRSSEFSRGLKSGEEIVFFST
jgi:hypothetical protein